MFNLTKKIMKKEKIVKEADANIISFSDVAGQQMNVFCDNNTTEKLLHVTNKDASTVMVLDKEKALVLSSIFAEYADTEGIEIFTNELNAE